MLLRNLSYLILFQLSLVACTQGYSTDTTMMASLAHLPGDSLPVGQGIPKETESGIIFRSTDGGATWQNISRGLPADADARSVYVNNGQVLLGTGKGLYKAKLDEKQPLWVKEMMVSRSADGMFPGKNGIYLCSYGQTPLQQIFGTDVWAPVFSNFKELPIYSIHEMPNGAVFLCTDTGIHKSSDGGKTWRQVFNEGLVLNIAVNDSMMIANGFKGVLRSADEGEHWNWVKADDGMALKTAFVGDRILMAITNGRPWQEARENPDSFSNKLALSTDLGNTWARVDQNISPFPLVYEMGDAMPSIKLINDFEQMGQYLYCCCDAGIFRSSDWGKTWEAMPLVNGMRSVRLTVHGGTIYAIMAGGC